MDTLLHRAATEASGRKIGIWHYDATSDTFSIDASTDLNERRLWSDCDVIPRVAPPNTQRIVLVGESAARGFLLDPELTPARRLNALLRHAGAASGTDFEVVDLARTCLTEPLTLMRQAAMLSPDAFVLFFGNNIRPATVLGLFDSSPEANELRATQAAALKEGGAADALALLDERAIETVYRPLLSECCELAARLSTPIVFVVPEHNRGDWRDTGNLDAPIGTVANNGASAADLSGLACLPPVPRRTEAFADCVRDVAHDYRETVVDLSPIIGKDYADRRMFYDYCHMTVAAIDTSARAIADALAERLDIPRPAPVNLPAPSPDVTARAAFLAAIHNAHWGQTAELVAYWLDAALDRNADVASDMAAYLDTMDQSIPRWMNVRAGSISDPRTQLGRVLFDNRPPPNEAVLAELISSRLTSRMQSGTRNWGADGRTSSLASAIGVFELLSSDQQSRFACRQNEFAAHGAVTEFHLPVKDDAWELVLFLRAGDIPAPSHCCGLHMDGEQRLEFDLDPSWRRVHVLVAPGRHSTHIARILWPADDMPRIEEAFEMYRRGERDSLLRITGRIHRSSVFRRVPVQSGQNGAF